jgi:diketogulonate reductase-like aldo/keto reductase
VNQVEIHPYFTQERLRQEHAKLGILTQAWSPIGGINVYWHEAHKTAGSPLVNRTVTDIATEVDRTPAQVVLRWQFQLGHCSIPKSHQAARMEENLDIFGFELSAEQIRRIDALDTGVRGGPDPDTICA